MTAPIVLAVDGGNSKTHLALVAADGHVRSLVRGPLSSPHHLGVDGCLGVLEQLFDEAVEQAGLPSGQRTRWPRSESCSWPESTSPPRSSSCRRSPARAGWAERVSVGNDTVALLRAGTERGWGVAVVCGAGINCIGVAPDGRQARFPALGEITGDWGGGYDVGMAAVSAAARSEDGRGPKTSLEQSVPAHFGLETPTDLAQAFHVGRIPRRSVLELSPFVFAEADHDEVAGAIVDRLAEEVVAMARAALTRLDLTDQPVEVVLGGGLLKSARAACSMRSQQAWQRSGHRSRFIPPARRRSSARRCSGSTSSARTPPHRPAPEQS